MWAAKDVACVDRYAATTEAYSNPLGRNLRNVCRRSPRSPLQRRALRHFPQAIPRRCILAATSERGACPACGAPWKRMTKDSGAYAALKETRTDESYGGGSIEGGKSFHS